MTEKMIILAIDTATGPTSVAVWKDGKVAAYLENPKPGGQSSQLVPMVESALAEAKIGYPDLTHVACTTGPGSFTGIRVGLAAARGICLAAKIPGLSFTTLEVLAHAAGKPSLAILNAGKGEVYYQAFGDNLSALYEPRVGSIECARASAPGLICTGNMESSPVFPRADALAELAAKNPQSTQMLRPFYIREPDAKPMAVDS